MKILKILYHLARRTDRRWALSEISPLDDSVINLLLSEKHHDEQLKKLMGGPT